MNDKGTKGAEKWSLNHELSSVRFIAKQKRLNIEVPRKWSRLMIISTGNFSSEVSQRLLEALPSLLSGSWKWLSTLTAFVFSGNFDASLPFTLLQAAKLSPTLVNAGPWKLWKRWLATMCVGKAQNNPMQCRLHCALSSGELGTHISKYDWSWEITNAVMRLLSDLGPLLGWRSLGRLMQTVSSPRKRSSFFES